MALSPTQRRPHLIGPSRAKQDHRVNFTVDADFETRLARIIEAWPAFHGRLIGDLSGGQRDPDPDIKRKLMSRGMYEYELLMSLVPASPCPQCKRVGPTSPPSRK
jgi:hypothetical protein